MIACGPVSAHTVAADAVARVYQQGGELRGCAHGHAPVRLGPPGADGPGREGVRGRVMLAGAYAAYVWHIGGVDTSSEQVRVVSLRARRVVRRDSAFLVELGPESFVRVARLVVTSRGRVAWTAEASGVGRPAQREVARDDGRGRAVLDAGTDVVLDSLRLRGATVRWRDGRGARKATLR